MPPANAPHPKLMNMKDKHFVTFTEAGKGRVLNEAKLKYLLSPGENKTARGLYINDLYFMLYAVFTTRSNYLLSINTTDHAIWRRQLFMFCEMTFVEKEAMFEPWHREINTYYIEEWVREKRICDAYFRILVHYNYVLLNEYDGKLKKVPHDRIKEWTKNIRNEQDQMKRYTNARLIKKKDESKTITIDDAVENFIVWYKKTDNSDPLSIFPKLVTEKLYHSEIKFDKETGIAKGWAFKE
jgi:phage/plasmid-associated DNA primase